MSVELPNRYRGRGQRQSAAQYAAVTVVLAHGAGAGRDHPWMRRVVTALASHDIETVTFNFPYMDAGRSAPDKPAVLEAHFAQVWQEAARTARGPMLAAGKSMGGRIASQVTAGRGFDPAPAGLVFFGYPLHPPNQPGKRRDAHLAGIAEPMLFLHGTRDPFGTPDEMRELTASLGRATLHLIDGGDHSLVVKRKDGADSIERAVAVAAGWMAGLPGIRA
jgi:predicted alpha/beta-hydrolase family hydrolase